MEFVDSYDQTLTFKRSESRSSLIRNVGFVALFV